MSNVQKIKAFVSEITNHGGQVYTVRFGSERRFPRFKTGQFLHLALDDFDPSTGFWPTSRVFSIATAPSSNEVCIAYSVKGEYTTRMERELCIGRSVWLKFPYGTFIIDTHVTLSQPVIIVAGGTGFTPFVSFLSREVDIHSKRPIRFFYGVKKASYILFPSVLKAACGSCMDFRLSLMVEEDYENAVLPAVKGRLDPDAIIATHHEFCSAPILLAGPPAMMALFKNRFSAAGIAQEKIIIDEWE